MLSNDANIGLMQTIVGAVEELLVNRDEVTYCGFGDEFEFQEQLKKLINEYKKKNIWI